MSPWNQKEFPSSSAFQTFGTCKCPQWTVDPKCCWKLQPVKAWVHIWSLPETETQTAVMFVPKRIFYLFYFLHFLVVNVTQAKKTKSVCVGVKDGWMRQGGWWGGLINRDRGVEVSRATELTHTHTHFWSSTHREREGERAQLWWCWKTNKIANLPSYFHNILNKQQSSCTCPLLSLSNIKY